MAIGRRGAAARQLATLFNVGVTGGLTDGQLLERFEARGGEGAELAFAALVERHGPLVLRVCRSVLWDEHEAHDAFQATFLVLVNKASSLWVCDSLAPWLHAVAYRVALCARGSAARRRRHELRHGQGLASASAAEDDGEAVELGAVLHEEIDRLPERYRVPIVLCDLEGRSHDEAARHLGWPVGTVKSRQARGRDRLRIRLVRRGVAPSVGLGAWVAVGVEGVTVSPALTNSTAAIAARTAASAGLAASAQVAALTKEVLMKILLGKLKWAGTFLLAIGLVGLGAWEFASRASGGVPGAGRGAARITKAIMVQADAPRDRPGKIYFGDGSEDGLIAVDPKTGEASKLLIQCRFRARISPDGRLIAFEWKGAVWVRELDKIVEPRKVLDLDGAQFGTPPIWSPDSSKLIVSLGRMDQKDGRWRFKTVRINIDGTGREELKIPDEDGVQDWSANGWLVTASSRNAKIGWELYVMKPDGSDLRQITEGGNPFYTRISPDGKRVLYTDGTTDERRGIWVVGVDGQNRRKVLPVVNALEWSACWSPDGKRIGVVVFDKPVGVEPPKGRLVILEVDCDGRTEFPLDDVKHSDMPDWR